MSTKFCQMNTDAIHGIALQHHYNCTIKFFERLSFASKNQNNASGGGVSPSLRRSNNNCRFSPAQIHNCISQFHNFTISRNFKISSQTFHRSAKFAQIRIRAISGRACVRTGSGWRPTNPPPQKLFRKQKRKRKQSRKERSVTVAIQIDFLTWTEDHTCHNFALL